ncbi:hypothetical protein [Polycyclovorans algicola]|nr:hypothetical protein [Polycyclovorans algicola]
MLHARSHQPIDVLNGQHALGEGIADHVLDYLLADAPTIANANTGPPAI